MITNYITSIDKFQAVSHYDTYLLLSVRMNHETQILIVQVPKIQ